MPNETDRLVGGLYDGSIAAVIVCPDGRQRGQLGEEKDMATILIVLVVLMLVGAIPAWPHSRSWGYGPSGGLGLILLVVVILFLTGRL